MLTVPKEAPFTGPQRMWLKGYLAGLSSVIAPTNSIPVQAAASPQGLPITIAWGSQTGTAESLARKLSKSLSSKGHSPKLIDMSDLTAESLSTIQHLLILTSTYGDGEPPDNALAFHSSIHQSDLSLTGLQFSVFALGDSSYPEFCKCGHDIQNRLTTLGAKSLLPIVEADTDSDQPFADWLKAVETSLSPH